MSDDWLLGTFRKTLVGFEPTHVDKTEVDGVTVSTVEIDDAPGTPYETAIGDATGNWYPVERYVTESEAREGHGRWVNQIPGMTEINRIGIEGIFDVPDEKIQLEREQS